MNNALFRCHSMLACRVNGHHSSNNRMRHEGGFNLIEVLVALLVLAFGLLGLAALQNLSLRSTHQSFQRTQATIAISDIVDRIRAATPQRTPVNPAYLTGGWITAPPVFNNCAAMLCSTIDLANYDIGTIMTNLQQQQSIGPTAQIQIVPAGAVPPLFSIGVRWMEGDLQIVQNMTVELP